MAFINDHVAIVLDQVRHVTFSEEALDESDIDNSRGPPFASSDKSNLPVFQLQERLQPGCPLFEKLLAVHQSDSVSAPRRELSTAE